MVILAYVLPVLILLFWQKRPVVCFIFAAAMLIIGLAILHYPGAIRALTNAGIDLEKSRAGLIALTFGLSIRPFLFGLPILFAVNFIRRHFYKKSAQAKLSKTTFS